MFPLHVILGPRSVRMEPRGSLLVKEKLVLSSSLSKHTSERSIPLWDHSAEGKAHRHWSVGDPASKVKRA